MTLDVLLKKTFLMRLRTLLIPSLLIGLTLVSLGGCSGPSQVEPSEEDQRFAAFYSDYLLASSLPERPEDSPAVVALDSAALGALLEKHGLDVGTLKERTEAYRQDPELWQQVLLMVREEIRLKNRSSR